MKKFLILAMSSLLVLSLFAGCRSNVRDDTTGGSGSGSQSTTHSTTQSTTQSTTHATTQPAETSRPTTPSTTPSTGIMPDTDMPGTGEGGTNRSGRVLPPRY